MYCINQATYKYFVMNNLCVIQIIWKLCVNEITEVAPTEKIDIRISYFKENTLLW